MATTDELVPDNSKGNAEYVRRLNQQLIQKESIIKLLQVKLKNLEVSLARQGRSGPGTGNDGDGNGGGAGLQEAIQKSEALSARVQELEKNLEAARQEGEELASELDQARQEAQKHRDAAPQESERQRKELKAARDEASRLKDEKAKLTRDLEAARALPKGSPDPLLAAELSSREHELAELRQALEIAQRELERQQQELASARAAAPATSAVASEPACVQAVIGILERIEILRSPSPGDVAGLVKGLAAHASQLARAAGVERISTSGTSYTPEVHHAVEMVYSSEHPHNTVIREVAPGYRAQGTIVRPADVVVSLNPYFCPTCQKVTIEGSRFCHICGAKVLGKEREGIRVLDDKASGQSHLELAWSQEEAGDLAGARAHYERALALDPRCTGALEGLARIGEREGRYEEALAHIETLIGQGADPEARARQRERIDAKVKIIAQLRNLV